MVSARPDFVDRMRELADLRRLADRGAPTLILIYGRRRVGKTYLLDHAWRDRRVFYFLAANIPDRLNREEMIRELSAWLGESLDPGDYPTWRTVFRLFVRLASQKPLIVVLDEFQYLLGHDDDAVSQLVAVWDREVGNLPLTLALSGSEVSTMEGLQHGGQPLYGRPTWSVRIRPFDYRDAALMVPNLGPRGAAMAYGVFGGTPRYLAAIDVGEPLRESIVRTLLSPRGEVYLQLQTLIEQERGIRETGEYRAVLAAVAGGRTQLNEIALGVGLADRAHVARRALEILEGLELVGRERNVDASEKAPHRYFIADQAVRFWYRFVFPCRSRLETGDAEAVWIHDVEPHLDGYMGKAFETICRDAYARYHEGWGLPGASVWARWEGRDRNRRSIELDVVARLDDDRLLTGDITWSSRPIGADVHRQLIRDLDDLARSGQGWATDALSPLRSAGYLYFSAAGFTEELRALASGDPMIRLLTLQDLYPPALSARP